MRPERAAWTRSHRMPRYLISFDAHAMDHIPDDDMPAVAKASHEVVDEALNAGVWVFGGGLENQKASIVATDGTVTDGPYPEAIGGVGVVDVASRQGALAWAPQNAGARRCAQQGRGVVADPAGGLDRGGGRGATSVLLARVCGVTVTACDLWVSVEELEGVFREAGVERSFTAVNADVRQLPFAGDEFDAIVSIDAFEYFGTDVHLLPTLLRVLKSGGTIGMTTPGLEPDPYEADVPDAVWSLWAHEVAVCARDSTPWSR